MFNTLLNALLLLILLGKKRGGKNTVQKASRRVTVKSKRSKKIVNAKKTNNVPKIEKPKVKLAKKPLNTQDQTVTKTATKIKKQLKLAKKPLNTQAQTVTKTATKIDEYKVKLAKKPLNTQDKTKQTAAHKIETPVLAKKPVNATPNPVKKP
jgi:hypothetical protein